MIKKTVTYVDYNDQDQTEDLYFNLSKLEIMELEISHEGGLQAYIEKLGKTENGTEAYYLFKDILLNAYGRKSEDGLRFVKTPEIRADLESSPALGEVIFGLIQDADSAAEFVKGLLPGRMVREVELEAAKKRAAGGDSPELPVAPPVLEGEPTDEELLKMSPKDMTHEQLQRAFRLKTQS